MSSLDGNNVQPMKPYQDKVERYTQFGYERPESFRIPRGKTLVLADTYLYLKPAEKTDRSPCAGRSWRCLQTYINSSPSRRLYRPTGRVRWSRGW